MAKKSPMTPAAAARIQSATAKANNGQVSKGSFAARATSAAAKNSSKGKKMPNTDNMCKKELDLWSDINNPNNDADMDDWADAHNPNNNAYIVEGN